VSDSNPLITIIDNDSAPRIVPFGEDFWLEDLPVGTRVIYPPPPLPGLDDVETSISYALEHPLGTEPLRSMLTPDMRITIAVDDISLPLPPMRTPDIRQRVVTAVLRTLGQAGVDDIHIVVAGGLHRRMTDAEIKRMLGKKVFKSFSPDRLYNHDAEDQKGLVELGVTQAGHPVVLNRRAVESDLLIYVNINLVPMNGGDKSVGVGLAAYETLRAHHTPQVLAETESYMEPSRSRLHDGIREVGRVIRDHLDVFHIETVLNNRMYPRSLEFLARNEDRFTGQDWRRFRGVRSVLQRLPRGAKRSALQSIASPYELLAVHAGATDPVHERTLEENFEQYVVPVQDQADVLITGIPYVSPYNVNSILNPVLVQLLGLGYFHNMHRGTPVLKKGGTLILCHPCYDQFHPEHHPSYVEFFHRLLRETRDAETLSEKYEREFAQNPSYVERYRHGHAYHGAHPFYMWYWGEAGRRHCGRVIAAGALTEEVPTLLGWERAEDLTTAIEMARTTAPPSPQITLLHHPPLFISDLG
jgi:hypothetical protein